MIKVIVESDNCKYERIFGDISLETLELLINGESMVNITDKPSKDTTISPKKRQMIHDELFKFDEPKKETEFTQKDLDDLFEDDAFWDEDKKEDSKKKPVKTKRVMKKSLFDRL